jgi:hypothetical protein
MAATGNSCFLLADSKTAFPLKMDRDEMSNLYKGPSIYASYQVSVQLAERFQRKRLKCEKLTDDGRRSLFLPDPLTKMAATVGNRLTLDPMGKCSNGFFSETTNMIKAKLYMNVHWMVLYKLYVFCSF